MKRMVARYFCSMVIFCLAFASLRADTVVLKSGESITGKILQETDTEVVLEYKVSAAITDQKSIPRAEIEKIEKLQPDALLYARIQNFKPDPEWSMQPETYERLIPQLNEFLDAFPQSSYAAEVKKNCQELAAEKQRVLNGELKMFGNWLTKEQAQKQQSQAQALAAFAAMRDRAIQGNYIETLNLFETMKTSCKNTLVFPAAVQLAASAMQTLEKQIAMQKQALLKEEENWKKTVAMTSEPQKSQFIASRQQNAHRIEAAFLASQRQGLKWAPIIPQSLKSLDQLEKTIATEKTALSSIPVAKMKQSVGLTNQAAEALSAKDLASAESLLQQAQGLWAENSALEYIKNEISRIQAIPAATPVEVKKEAKKAVAKVAAAPTPKPEESLNIAEFLMTPKGAALLVVALLALIAIGTLVVRFTSKAKLNKQH